MQGPLLSIYVQGDILKGGGGAYLGGGAIRALMMPLPLALLPSLVALKASTASSNA